MVWRRVLVACIVPTLGLAACGGDDDDSGSSDDQTETAEEPSGGGEPEGDSGGGDMSGDAPDLGDFPIPAPPGSDASLVTDSESATAYLATIDVDQVDAVIAFYDDWTSSQSTDFQRVEAEAGGVSWIGSVDDGLVQSISVSAPIPGDDQTFVSLTFGSTG